MEIKNSTLGAGTKVPHLSYIGDTEVGERSNLGAGTITANYDGYAKHPTTIGAGVRLSVHTSLVAPVNVGDGAYTGAGSVITEDVPPGGARRSRGRARPTSRATRSASRSAGARTCADASAGDARRARRRRPRRLHSPAT